jgi:restriction system protein
VIVQCKRQKAKIEKVVIKALYADVVAEKAKSGMIVTTSRLSAGAEATRTARNYPLQVADRDTLKAWLSKLRVPGAGIVM